MKKAISGMRILIITLILASGLVVHAGTSTQHGRLSRSSDCMGGGICSSKAIGVGEEPTTFRISFDPTASSITLTIGDDQYDTLPTIVAQNLELGRFIMTEPFTFNVELSRAVGSPDLITVPVGNYKVTHQNNEYSIVINLE